MHSFFATSLLLLGCVHYATAANTQDETMQRIRDLEERLAKAEALIQQLMARAAAPPVVESAASIVAPVAAPEVSRSERQTMTGERGMPQELLPNLGLIGASSSFSAGIHTGPYSSGRGTYLSGGVSLPLMKAPGGQLLYDFSAGLTRSDSQLTITSNVAQVANLAVLGPGLLTDALQGTGAAPFPVQVSSRSKVDVLQVIPFGLKYQNASLSRWRLRPYVVAGFGLFVTISNQTTLTGLRNAPALNALFGNGAPFGGALIGGQIAAAKELTALGLPSGQGGISPGFQTGGGIEWRVKPRLSWGLDMRWNKLGNGANFITIAPRGAFHF